MARAEVWEAMIRERIILFQALIRKLDRQPENNPAARWRATVGLTTDYCPENRPGRISKNTCPKCIPQPLYSILDRYSLKSGRQLPPLFRESSQQAQVLLVYFLHRIASLFLSAIFCRAALLPPGWHFPDKPDHHKNASTPGCSNPGAV